MVVFRGSGRRKPKQMTVRVGINGMGRIGRLVLRAVLGGVRDYALVDGGILDVVHLNEVAGDAATTAHLLEFDSVHGRWREEITSDSGSIIVASRMIGHSTEGSPGDVPWDSTGVDVVLECTGRFRTPELLAPYFESGVREVIVAAPHKDLRRARSSLSSLIPTTTGSATAISLIYPELQGQLNGLAVRVPILNAFLTDCVFEVSRPTTSQEVNTLLREAAAGPLAGILGYEDRPLVSADYVDDVRSSFVDGPSTMVVDDTQVKILAWYDNEMGYACRMVELAVKVARMLDASDNASVAAR